MCGNGIRVFHAWLRERGLAGEHVTIETLGGTFTVESHNDRYRVAMGQPAFRWQDLGAKGKITPEAEATGFSSPRWPEALRRVRSRGVAFGNPHWVFFLPSLEELPIGEWGSVVENDPLFPQRINVEFAHILDPHTVEVKVWERGAGATLACGTGATAVVACGWKEGWLEPPVEVRLPGGRLTVDREGETFYLEGPVTFVATGQVDLTASRALEEVRHV